MKNNIEIGAVYKVKVTGRIVPVQIVAENPGGGWDGVNIATNKRVRIKTAARLRERMPDPKDLKANKVKASPKNADVRPSDVTFTNAPQDATPTKQRDTAEPDAKASDKTVAKPLSLLNAAVIVLKACERPLSCKTIIEKAIDADIWHPKTGKTPANTLSAAIRREIKTKGDASRFQLVERGKFMLTSKS